MRTLFRNLISACALALPAIAGAQADYPNRPIRLIVPYAAGGTSDLLARYIGQKLTDSWGQPVIVDNRPGGGTVIGASAVAKSPPDGYTFLLANNTHVINAHLMASLPYDALKDFTPAATLATSAYLLLLNPSVPANDLRSFLALARSQPGKLNFGTHGVGGLTHLAAELLNSMAGIRLEMVQYKGAGPAMAGILGGEVQVYLDAPATTIPHVQSGKLRAIGITGTERLPTLAQVPTVAEAGLPGFDVTIWYGLLGPAGMPASIVAKLTAEINRVLAQPDVREKLVALGVTPYPSTGDAFSGFMRREHERYGRVIRDARITIN